MTKIALLVPTRGRPEKFKRMCESAFKTASNKDNVSVLAALTEDDETKELYKHEYSGSVFSFIHPESTTVYKWNWLAGFAQAQCFDGEFTNKLFMLAADDIIFETPGWDKALIDHYNALENKIHVYALRDSRDPDGTPHPIVTREYLEAMGYFVPPIFLHWFVDTWTVAIANSNNAFTHLKDFLLTHDKPSDRGQPDETHTGIRARGWHSRDHQLAKSHCRFLEYEKMHLYLAMHGERQKWRFNKKNAGELLPIMKKHWDEE